MLQCFQSHSLSFFFFFFSVPVFLAGCVYQSSTNKSARHSLLVCALCQLKPHKRSQGNTMQGAWPVKGTQNRSSKAGGAFCHQAPTHDVFGQGPSPGEAGRRVLGPSPMCKHCPCRLPLPSPRTRARGEMVPVSIAEISSSLFWKTALFSPPIPFIHFMVETAQLQPGDLGFLEIICLVSLTEDVGDRS